MYPDCHVPKYDAKYEYNDQFIKESKRIYTYDLR